MELDRVLVHGNHISRNGVLHNLDVSVRETQAMKEVTIVLVILILAVWAWKPRKGGRE